MENNDKSAVAELPGPRLPADHGLSSLGLIMQLGGTVYLILMAFLALTPVILSTYTRGGGEELWRMFLVCSIGAVRSAFHRAAGTTILYGSPAGPYKAVRSYIVIGLIQAALLPLLLKSILPVKAVLPLSVMAAAWPATLAVIFALPRFRRYREEIPHSEDLGFEGASVLMVLLGVIGALSMGLVLVLMFQAPGSLLESLEGVLVVCMAGMLLVRAILHTMAGKKGIRGASLDEATRSAASYFSFGVTSSFVVGGTFLLMSLVNKVPFLFTLLFICSVVAFLLSWPMILRRFYSERNFAVLLGGDDAPAYHRAPDAGLTALGWLLLAFATVDLAGSLAGLLFPSTEVLSQVGVFNAGGLAQMFGQSPWWSVLIAGLQLWAAIELITMGDRFKTATLVYGVTAAVVRVFVVMWPMFKDIDRFSRGFGGAGGMLHLGENLIWGMIALALVIPIGAVLLVLREQTPQATARFRPSSPTATAE